QSQGGGIAIISATPASPVLTVRGSTISGNSAGGGGGLFARNAAGVIQDSTISGNTATGDGGGIDLDTDLPIRNSTIAFNRAGTGGTGFGGGVKGGAISVTLQSTIVANNSAASDGPDLFNNFNLEYCLIGYISGASFNDNGHNIFGIAALKIDPLLAPLDFYGGPTQTHALKKGSLAINRGFNFAGLPFDQRGPGHKR